MAADDDTGETDYSGFLYCLQQDNEIIGHVPDKYPNAAKQHKSVGIYPTRVIRVLGETFKLRRGALLLKGRVIRVYRSPQAQAT